MVRLQVHRLLKDRNMNAHELSLLARIPVTTAYRLADSRPPQRIDLRTIDRLCAALHVDPCELLEYDIDRPRARRRKR